MSSLLSSSSFVKILNNADRRREVMTRAISMIKGGPGFFLAGGNGDQHLKTAHVAAFGEPVLNMSYRAVFRCNRVSCWLRVPSTVTLIGIESALDHSHVRISTYMMYCACVNILGLNVTIAMDNSGMILGRRKRRGGYAFAAARVFR